MEFIQVPDYVTISKKGDPQYGLIGKVQYISDDHATILVYGKERHKVPLSSLSLYAKFGNRAYSKLSPKVLEWNLNNLTLEDYDSLMDFALSLKDYNWCKDIIKNKLELSKKVVRKK